MSDAQRNVVIVGASAAGLRCASRLVRLKPDWTVKIVEARKAFSYGACGMPYVLSGDIPDLETLHKTADGDVRDEAYFAQVKGVEVLTGQAAVGIDVEERYLEVNDAEGNETSLPYDDLVLATGAWPRHLPGQPDHPRVVTFHTPADVKPLHEGLARGKIGKAVIIGAGFLGCELAEAFTALWGAEVTLVEAGDAPLPGLLDPEIAAHVARHLADNDVELRCNARVAGIDADDKGVTVRIEGGEPATGDVAVVAVGVEPAVELAVAAGVELGPTGAVAVDDRLATSVPGIWAVGDVAETRHVVTGDPVHIPLGSLANRMGRTLANVLAGGADRFPPVAGASALKVFDLNVAATGLTRRAAAARGDAPRSVWISAHDTADYWPESKEIFLQLTYLPDTGRVIGVQAVGEGEVAKRADVATQLLARGATLADFAHLEHAYSPPYAPALEPLAVAAMVAENQEAGLEALSPSELCGGLEIMDVRHPSESEERSFDLKNTAGIPLDTLRDRIDDVDLRPWVVVCERGPRSAEAVRLLQTREVTAVYLGGGLRWREMATPEASESKT